MDKLQYKKYLKSENRLTKPKNIISPRYTKQGFMLSKDEAKLLSKNRTVYY